MYKSKKNYVIDFTNVKYYLEMHYVIKEALDFPDYYGCNWSAFWDCLTDMYGDIINIKIIGIDVIKNKFDDAAEKMIEILKRFKHYSHYFEDDITIEIFIGDEKTLIQ